MSIFWWMIIIILFLLSFIGIVMPVIPGVPFIWAGFLIYHYGIESLTGWNFWVTMIFLTIFILIVDYLVSSRWVKRWGGSKAGAWAAIGGLLIGPFIFGPIGVIIVPFLFVTVTEMLRGIPWSKAIKIGFASFIGLLGGSLLKIFLQLMMIVIFLMKIWL